MIQHLQFIQQLTYFTFIIALFGMIGGSVFFFSQKSEVHKSYRSVASISGVICLIAAMTYFIMKGIYLDGASSNAQYRFPTEFRYIDWIITVPLMLIKFPGILGMGKRGQAFMTRLILFALIMLGTAFVGEVNLAKPALHYGFYGVSVVFWLMIIGSLTSALRTLPPSTSEAKAATIRRMYYFILIGWIIYPLGYLAPDMGLAPDIRELVYNIGDIINKVGLGLAVIAGGVREVKEA